jgi:hypothetical protein
MRALSWSLTLLVAVTLGGCASDIQAKVMCSTDTECFHSAGTLYSDVDVDASADLLPRCCAGFCVVPSLGCDEGFRYLTHDPNNEPAGGYGECVASPMCPVPPQPDLSEPADMSMTD